MVWESMDYLEGTRYIALNRSEAWCRMSELKRVLPWRRSKTGTRPGITGAGPKGKERGDMEQWEFPDVELTEDELAETFSLFSCLLYILAFNQIL